MGRELEQPVSVHRLYERANRLDGLLVRLDENLHKPLLERGIDAGVLAPPLIGILRELLELLGLEVLFNFLLLCDLFLRQ